LRPILLFKSSTHLHKILLLENEIVRFVNKDCEDAVLFVECVLYIPLKVPHRELPLLPR
jgi:hypothetical protein